MRRHSRQGQPPSPQRQSRKRHRALCSVAMTLSVVTLGACSSSADTVAARHDAVQHSLDALVSEDGLPAALASIQDRNGNSRNYTAGVGDLTTGSEVPLNGQIRIGSNTKTFTAVVVLQLVAEGKIELDTPIETYLPGLVRGDGIDGHNITIRQLLQHTSGLPNYSNYLEDEVRYYDPRELLDIALEHPADFAPGTSWKYSNTNYVLAGLLVQKITEKPLAEEMNRRIFAPIDLQHTYFPEPYDEKISELHPRGYYRESSDAPPVDITEIDPSWGWAAGQLISTTSDLNQFLHALLDGRLLPAAQLDQMRTTVPAEETFGPDARYGLGLVSRPLPCGGLSWSHGGSFPGYETRGGATDDGREANIAVSMQVVDDATRRKLEHAVAIALCR